MSSHTPGPWEARDHGQRALKVASHIAVHDPETNTTIAVLPIGGFHTLADARLISAAPEMLKALGACITALSFEGEEAARRGDEIALRQIHAAREAAYAAIAKAEGRS